MAARRCQKEIDVKNSSALVLLLGSVFSHAAFAGEINCASPQTTLEINYCANLDYKAADASLNEVYQEAIKSLGTSEQNDVNSKGLVAALRQAELKWIDFRDADCALVKKTWTNGTGGTAALLGCLTQKTNERIQFLRENILPGC
jgi:uncharacterized protein YecT (DUF1311 family)